MLVVIHSDTEKHEKIPSIVLLGDSTLFQTSGLLHYIHLDFCENGKFTNNCCHTTLNNTLDILQNKMVSLLWDRSINTYLGYDCVLQATVGPSARLMIIMPSSSTA